MKSAFYLARLVLMASLVSPIIWAVPNDSGFIKYYRPSGGAFDPAVEHQSLSVDYDNEQIGKILYDIARLYDLEITFPKRVSGIYISLKLEKVSYRFALEMIAKKASLKVIFGKGEALLD